METTILGLASLALAIVLAGIGVAGQRGRQRAVGRRLIAAAGPALLLGVALLVRPPEQVSDWFLVYAIAGVATGGLIALARRQAQQAARDLDDA
jgi:hypothetical protein